MNLDLMKIRANLGAVFHNRRSNRRVFDVILYLDFIDYGGWLVVEKNREKGEQINLKYLKYFKDWIEEKLEKMCKMTK